MVRLFLTNQGLQVFIVKTRTHTDIFMDFTSTFFLFKYVKFVILFI